MSCEACRRRLVSEAAGDKRSTGFRKPSFLRPNYSNNLPILKKVMPTSCFFSEPEFKNRLSVVLHAAKEKYPPNRPPNCDATLAIKAVRLFHEYRTAALSPASETPEGGFWAKKGSGRVSPYNI